MTTLKDNFADGAIFYAGTANATNGASGLNDITTQINRNTNGLETGSAAGLAIGINLKRSVINTGVTGSAVDSTTWVTLGSKFFTPSSSIHMIMGVQFAGSFSSNTNAQARITITPSYSTSANDDWKTTESTSYVGGGQLLGGSSTAPRVFNQSFMATTFSPGASGIIGGLFGAGSYLVKYQGATSSLGPGSAGFFSGAEIRLYYFDYGLSGAGIS